jgi:hypothetical protein
MVALDLFRQADIHHLLLFHAEIWYCVRLIRRPSRVVTPSLGRLTCHEIEPNRHSVRR